MRQPAILPVVWICALLMLTGYIAAYWFATDRPARWNRDRPESAGGSAAREVCGGRALPDCQLLLWAPSSKLAEAMEVLSAWSFSYRTCAVWDKEVIGPGYFFRQQHELLLLAARARRRRGRP
jgi:hypothetical protein